MLPPKQQEPICCEGHTRRYVPIPETLAEAQAVAWALEKWDDEYYLRDDVELTPVGLDVPGLRTLPPWVRELLPDAPDLKETVARRAAEWTESHAGQPAVAQAGVTWPPAGEA